MYFFLRKNQIGGNNIDLWAFDELCEMVKEFKRRQDKEKDSSSSFMPTKKQKPDVTPSPTDVSSKKVYIIYIN